MRNREGQRGWMSFRRSRRWLACGRAAPGVGSTSKALSPMLYYLMFTYLCNTGVVFFSLGKGKARLREIVTWPMSSWPASSRDRLLRKGKNLMLQVTFFPHRVSFTLHYNAMESLLMVATFPYITKTKCRWIRVYCQIDVFVYLVTWSSIHSSLSEALSQVLWKV